MKFTKSQALLLKLGAAKGKYRAAWRLIDIVLPEAKKRGDKVAFSFRLNRQKLRAIRRREGRYLLRTNLTGREPAQPPSHVAYAVWLWMVSLTSPAFEVMISWSRANSQATFRAPHDTESDTVENRNVPVILSKTRA
jgi:hypothetical protein